MTQRPSSSHKKPAHTKAATGSPAAVKALPPKPAAAALDALPAKGKPEGNSPTLDQGLTSFKELLPRLMALPSETLKRPRADIRTTATFVLGLSKRIADSPLGARFASLPKSEFDVAVLQDLPKAAHAVLYTQLQQDMLDAQQTAAKVPPEVATPATAHRKKMLDVCKYNLSKDPEVARELRSIRQGHGYLDLAQDLTRLAALYENHRTTLALDHGHYVEGDDKLALRFAADIRAALGGLPGNTAVQIRSHALRAIVLLQRLYEDVAATGRWLLRNEGGDELFPSLYRTSYPTSRRRKTPAAPIPPKPTQPGNQPPANT